jgi:hypothetical protein
MKYAMMAAMLLLSVATVLPQAADAAGGGGSVGGGHGGGGGVGHSSGGGGWGGHGSGGGPGFVGSFRGGDFRGGFGFGGRHRGSYRDTGIYGDASHGYRGCLPWAEGYPYCAPVQEAGQKMHLCGGGVRCVVTSDPRSYNGRKIMRVIGANPEDAAANDF